MASPPNIPDSSVPGMLARSQPPEAWIYDRDPANGIARATFNGEVYAQTINSPAAGVSAFNGRTGSVTLDLADVEAAGGAPLNAPSFTGLVSVPTAAPGTATTEAASTAYVMQAISASAGVVSFNGRTGAVSLTLSDVTSVGGAPLAGAALTNPTANTPAVGDNSSNLATTAFVNNWAAANTVLSFNGRRGAVTLTLSDIESAGGAPILSPSFSGVPQAATAAPGTATQQLATCAFVTNAVTGGTAGVASFNTRTGAVTLTTADIVAAGGLPSVSGAMTGVPTAPTASAGTNSNQVATCAFVETAVSSMAPVVTSFNGREGAVTLTLADVTSVGGAPLASPALTGTPSAPEPTLGDNSTRLATTSFVAGTLAALPAYMPLAGGTFSGPVTMAGAAAAANQPVTLAQLNAALAMPTVQRFITGTGTYTPAAGVRWIRVRMVAGGGGGGGTISGAAGGAGGNTSFGGWTAIGGLGGGAGVAPPSQAGAGAGGGPGANGTGTVVARFNGGSGESGWPPLTGQVSPFTAGGSSAFGGFSYASGTSFAGNGSGGNGAASGNTGASSGGGGGAGEYAEFLVNAPVALAYAVAAGGAAGTGTNPGGNGGNGIIIVEEHY